MKIAVACVNMKPENTRRQPWYYMNSIVKGLSRKGYDVWILTDKEEKWTRGRKTIIFKKFRSFPLGINTRLSDLVVKEGFDAIIWSTGLTDFFFKNKIDVLKIPVIAVVTSPRYFFRELLSFSRDFILNKEFTKQFFLGPFISKRRVKEFLAIPNLKAIVFECNETLTRYIPNLVDKERIFVIPPPLPEVFVNILNEVKTEKEDYEKKHFKILYFGPPVNLRGIDTLIHAMDIVAKRVRNVRLDILSRIEHEKLLKHERKIFKLIKKKELDSHVSVISGLLTLHEIIKYIISSDVVCLPFKCVVSDVPLAVLETIATGVPLITTDIVGVSEFAKNENCIVIPAGDYRTLAEAIITILRSDSKRIKKSDIKKFLNNYSLKKFSLSFEKILKEKVL